MDSQSHISLQKSTHHKLLPWLVCSIGALFYCYAYFLRVSPSNMMNELMAHFHITAATFGTLSAFYYYAYTPMQLPVGVIIDRYGVRLVLSLACLVCVGGLAIFIAANNLYLAAMGRFFIGFGSAFAYITVLKLATLWLPPNRFATVAGSTTAFGMAAAIFSDLYLSKFVHTIGYKNALFSSLMVGIALSVIILLFIRSKPKDSVDTTDKSKITFKELFSGLRVILMNPQMWLIGLVGCLLYLPASVFLDLWGIPYFETVFNLTPIQAASVISMVFFGWIIAAPFIGAISDKIKLRRIPLTIAGFLAGILICILFYVPHLSLTSLYIIMLLFGMFCGSHPLCFSLSRELNPNRFVGTSTAVANCLIMLGGVIFQPIVGLLLDFHWDGTKLNGLPVYSSYDFTFALSILPISLILASSLSFLIKETHCRLYVKQQDDRPTSTVIEPGLTNLAKVAE